MTDSIQNVRIEIFGKEYNIRGEADPQYIQRVAAYVDRKMREINEKLPLPSLSQVAILASLNIADELLRERDERQRSATAVREKAGHLEELLISTLAVAPAPALFPETALNHAPQSQPEGSTGGSLGSS